MKYIFLFGFLFISLSFQAQVLSPRQARAELQRRGIDDKEVERRLAERGIDINNIDQNNPAALAKAEIAITEVIAEIEAEKQAKETIEDAVKTEAIIDEQAKDIAKEAEDISEAVKDGATLEEAISEELIENQNKDLPPSKIYGQEIFRNQSIKVYRQSEDVKPPESYILGVGDEISVHIWGYIEENLNFEISKEGYIKPVGIPRIFLKGLTFGQSKKLLLSRFQKYYRFRPQEFEVTLNSSRNINVRVAGEVFNFGNFNLPAINTAFNTLVAAGGPNDIGSVRRIKLIRDGAPDKTLDVYKYLQDPSINKEFYLQENDIIHVPRAGKVVTISGAITRPYKYELLDNEDLFELIDIAGGLRENAFKNSIQVKRYVNDKESIIDVALGELERIRGDFSLFNGDVISINVIPETYQNYVTITGPVEVPGKYALNDNNNTLSALLKKAIVKPEAVTSLAYIKRLNDDQKTIKYIPINLDRIKNDISLDLKLEPKDQILIVSKSTFSDATTIEVTGSVRNPNSFDYDNDRSLRVADAIYLAGGINLQSSEIGFVERIDSSFVNARQFIRVNIYNAIKNPTSDDNILLDPNDRLRIYPKSFFTDEAKISIGGLVRNPGQYEFSSGLNLNDVITMSGGLQLSASKNRIDIYRVNLLDDGAAKILAATLNVEDHLNEEGNIFYLEPFDQIIVRALPDFELQQMVTINGKVKYPGSYALIADNERISDVIERAGGLSPEAFLKGSTLYREEGGIGYIVIDLEESLKAKGSEIDVILKRGDILNIPEKNNIVTITGAVNLREVFTDDIVATNKIAAPFVPGKNAKQYIDSYGGGIADHGSNSKIYVRQADGAIQRTKNFLFFKKYPEVEPGSTIVVGVKPPPKSKDNGGEKSKTDWGEVVGNTVAQATSVLTLILLLQRLD